MSVIITKRASAIAMLMCSVALAGCLGDGKLPSSVIAAGRAPVDTAGNHAPAITGTPVTLAKTNQPYAFQPKASDPDGDPLTFTVQNKPAWATFDAKTGRLAGTPSSSYTGTFAGIRIVASDGKSQSTLPSFDITVAATTATGNATLSWQPPTENVDGSPLTNLAGYVIRYGQTAGALDEAIKVGNAGTTMYVVENLGQGTWYFALSAVNAAGVESNLTEPVSKTIS